MIRYFSILVCIAGVAVAADAVGAQPGAPVEVVLYSDFQCPFCGRFVQETFSDLRTAYVDVGKVQVAFRHVPLPIHDRAERAAEAAECAATQGKF